MNKESFEKAAPLYQSAISKSGYNHQLKFESDSTSNREITTETNSANQPPKRPRHRNVMWYNPPFSKNVKTNVGRNFLNIVKDSFKKGHPLHKIFSKNTLKVSCLCMVNLGSKISAHNKSLLEKSTHTTESIQNTYNCKDKPSCPLNGAYLTSDVIYQATRNKWKRNRNLHRAYGGQIQEQIPQLWTWAHDVRLHIVVLHCGVTRVLILRTVSYS